MRTAETATVATVAMTGAGDLDHATSRRSKHDQDLRNGESPTNTERWTPDPLRNTDRYRLVMPYLSSRRDLER